MTFPKKHGGTAVMKPASNAAFLPLLIPAEQLKSDGLYSASVIRFLIYVDLKPA
jgi:hypothetical protein